VTAVRPLPATLVGRFITLEPLTPALLPELHRAISHPAVFEGGYGGGPAGLCTNAGDFVAWAAGYYQWTGLPYAVRLVGGPHDGDLVGTSTLGDIEPRNESAHIGWTAYDPRVWGTAVNAEAKLLLLGAAFDNGFGRVKIQADAVNERSRAAIAGIGATFEGILRRDRPRADGTWRDTAVSSILVEEWPRVREGLRARLDRYGETPVRYRADRAGAADAPASASPPATA
jgi:RimJ/RimL family protein N-acetyltransferase